MRIAVVASLAVHAVLIAWLSSRVRDRAPRLLARTMPTIETLVNVELFEQPAVTAKVALLQPAPDHATAKVPATHVREAAKGAPASPAAASATSAPAAPAPGAPASARTEPARTTSDTASHGASPRSSLAMRHVDLSPAQIVDGAPPGDGAPPAGERTGELRPAGHGTYTTDLGGSDWRTRTATAHVARDGTVHFDNAPDFDIHFVGVGFVGKFNPDDWLARKAGIDPYASAKLAYLDRTRDERVRIAEANRTADLAHAAIAMQRNVAAARALPDLAARKQVLFELWDDVAESGDVALVRAGAEARAYLVGAIRAMRPALEFTPDELAQLNAHRRSRAVFAPYG